MTIIQVVEKKKEIRDIEAREKEAQLKAQEMANRLEQERLQRQREEEERAQRKSEERKRIVEEKEQPEVKREEKGPLYNKLLIVASVLGILLLGYWMIVPGSNDSSKIPDSTQSKPTTTVYPAPIITFELKLQGNGVNSDTVDLLTEVIKNRLEIFGIKNATINKSYEKSSITVDLPSIFASKSNDIFKEGKFEIRIQVKGNETEHVIYGTDITPGLPEKEKGDVWGVSFTLSDAGAAALRDAAIQYGAVTAPSSHNLIMTLDENVVFDAPLSPNLARNIQSVPVKKLVATTGTGDEGQQKAEKLMIYLRTGALPMPVDVKIVRS